MQYYDLNTKYPIKINNKLVLFITITISIPKDHRISKSFKSSFSAFQHGSRDKGVSPQACKQTAHKQNGHPSFNLPTT